MNPIILELVKKHKIEITIDSFSHNEEELIGFNVNTGAKSGLTLVENDDGTFTGYGRYNEVHENLSSIYDIADRVRYCMMGRDYVNSNWLTLMEKLDIVRVKRETVTKIIF